MNLYQMLVNRIPFLFKHYDVPLTPSQYWIEFSDNYHGRRLLKS
jgi:hypothetical protein